MEYKVQRDWGLVVSGIILIICAAIIIFYPGLTLAALTLIAGIAFLVSGIFDIVGWSRFRNFMLLSGWNIVYAVLNILFGLMLIIHPIAFSVVLPWLIGFFLLVFGIAEVVGSFAFRRAAYSQWGISLASGIVGILCAVMLFIWPASITLFLAFFIIMRGISMITHGINTGTLIR
ncbi:MAG: HdeD family acid-resistance protein [Eggerthellaceae bacterium]|jgi:uncharacterized membrane protein HdeD (DUF308 family)